MTDEPAIYLKAFKFLDDSAIDAKTASGVTLKGVGGLCPPEFVRVARICEANYGDSVCASAIAYVTYLPRPVPRTAILNPMSAGCATGSASANRQLIHHLHSGRKCHPAKRCPAG
jgi:hypothetical protein